MTGKDEIVTEMAEKLAKLLEGDNNTRVTQPMKTDITSPKKKAELESLISYPKRDITAKKLLKGFKTGTFLDKLFFDVDENCLDGIPIAIQLGITGLPSSGKSILIEEIAIKVANSGRNVLLVTSEDSWELKGSRLDLQARLYQKAEILLSNGIVWENLSKNLFVLDTMTKSKLRSWSSFAEAYRYMLKEKKINLVLIDSVTLLDTYRGALKDRLRELCRVNQLDDITGIYVNQRATEDWDNRGMAGGIGLGHILDSTVIIDYGVPSSWKRYMKEDFLADFGIKIKQGETHNFVRVLGCRLCRFDGKYKPVQITPDGFLKIKQPQEVE